MEEGSVFAQEDSQVMVPKDDATPLVVRQECAPPVAQKPANPSKPVVTPVKAPAERVVEATGIFSAPASMPMPVASDTIAVTAEQRLKSQLVASPTGRSDSDTESDETEEPSSPAPVYKPTPSETTAAEDEEDEKRFVDEFGFELDEDEKEMEEKFARHISGKKIKRREIKWGKMTEDWSRTNVKMYAKLKERCRKGIPSRLRNVAWQLLIGSHVEMQDPNNAGVYKALCAKVLRNKEIDLVLSRDLNRTFPNHVMFKEDGGVGQTFLKNVLHAYAGTDPEVGYVQGMGFIVGAFSTQLSEEESFWALHSIMYSERYKMRELFKPGFPLLQQFFYQFKRLLARLLPKLSKRFEELSVDPSFYASQWFLTLFVYHFPFRALLRIWDIFFCEGWKIIFRTAIALLKWEQKKLLSLPFEELLPTLKSIQDGKDSRELLERAHKVKFKTVELNQYGNEYWESIGRKPEV